jgi:hypothetical protein
MLLQIVRDFTLSAHTAQQLQELQRSFTTLLLGSYKTTAQQTTKASRITAAYSTTTLKYHLKGAVTTPLCDDELAKIALLHDVPSIF